MRKKARFITAMMAIVMFVSCIAPIEAFAGTSYAIIDKTSFQEKINNADWSNPGSSVISKDGKLIFPEDSTNKTRLISKNAAKYMDNLSSLFEMQVAMKLVKIPSGQEFVVACGVSSIEGSLGDKGNVELVFTNNGGLKVSLRVYEEKGKATTLVQAKNVGASVGSNLKINASLSAQQEYTVTVNGKQVFKGKLPVSGQGRIGFLQTGGCAAEILDLELKVYSYDRPENSNIEESFDDGAFNKALLTNNMLFTYKYYPTSVSVEEYDGDSVFMFHNAANSYFGTRQKYSNFEMSFDVPYVQRKEIVEEDGTVTMPRNPWIGVSYGSETSDQPLYGYQQAGDLILFQSNSEIQSYKPEVKVRAALSGTDYDFYAPDETRGFSVKLKMVDAHMEIGIKWIEEKEFKTVASYDLEHGNTLTGHIHIWALEVANFAIDNVVIKNLDADPNLVEAEYVSSKVIVPPDFAFEKAEMVYNPNVVNNSGLWYLLISCSVLIAALCVLIPLSVKKTRSRKEGGSNEK